MIRRICACSQALAWETTWEALASSSNKGSKSFQKLRSQAGAWEQARFLFRVALRCDLRVGYSWLHFTTKRRQLARSCDLRVGYSWLHSFTSFVHTSSSCDLRVGYSWLHLRQISSLCPNSCDLRVGYSWLHFS